MTRPASRGFTLVELAITVALVGILLALALPAFSDFFDRSRVRGAADDVATMISQVRAEAVKAGRNVTVSTGGTTAAWCVGANVAPVPAVTQPIAASVACDCTVANACVVEGTPRVVASTAYSGVTFGAVGANFVIDGRLGNITGLAGPSIDMTSPKGKYQLRLQVSPLGQSRVCVPAGQPAVPGYPSC